MRGVQLRGDDVVGAPDGLLFDGQRNMAGGDKEQTLKTLWGKEKLDECFPRQELVDEMRKLHEEHREAKRKAQEDIDMWDAEE